VARGIEGGFDGGPIVPEPSRERLTDRQLDDYTEHRVRLIEWMENLGKSPSEGKGYAQDTVNARAYRLDLFIGRCGTRRTATPLGLLRGFHISETILCNSPDCYRIV
jgi:hypothetical protein